MDSRSIKEYVDLIMENCEPVDQDLPQFTKLDITEQGQIFYVREGGLIDMPAALHYAIKDSDLALLDEPRKVSVSFSVDEIGRANLSRALAGRIDKDRFSEQTVDDLTTLRDTLFERGWIQHEMRTDQGVCLLGGIGELPYHERQGTIRLVLDQYLTEMDGEYHTIPSWNDATGRTFGQVIEMLDGCIAWVKEKING